MPISQGLMAAILSMDAYNRGYGAGIKGLSDNQSTGIGDANVTTTSTSALIDPVTGQPVDKTAGFYAVAYNWNGQTVISYRGTDNAAPTGASDITKGGSDFWNGWTLSAGFSGASQVVLAEQFYAAATGLDPFAGGAPSNVVLTGHSLGGGLAGADYRRTSRQHRMAA